MSGITDGMAGTAGGIALFSFYAASPQASSYKAWQSLRWQLASSRVSISGDLGGGCKIYYDLVLEVRQHHFCCILLAKKQNTGPAHIKGR